jgi:hypothetical protein
LCLNWCGNVQLENGVAPWNTIAGSAWYIAPSKLEVTDDEVNTLHRDGVYYSIAGKRWHVFYLNYAAHSLLLRKQRVFVSGPQAVAPKGPPLVAARKVWSPPDGSWIVRSADDGFTTFLQPFPSLSAALPLLCQQSPLAVERALELLEGPEGNVTTWYTLAELQALKVADEESIRRVTVSQETDNARAGVKLRRQRTRLAETALIIPAANVQWPAWVEDLSAGFRYRWTATRPHDNVESLNGGEPAALVYLGENPEDDWIGNVHARLSRARIRHVASQASGTTAGDAVSRANDRLCVAYRKGNQLQFHRPSTELSITDPGTTQSDDLARE